MGELQEDQPPPSSWHSNVEPPSVDENVKLGPVTFDGSAGDESIEVFGAALSIVKVREAGAPWTFVARSVARARTV